ncbi:MAG: DUF1580 domain-containing protein [Pirellulaceae bacterium]|nr:DUF1580 domain-containing protein [Planctomycetales bacterium]
MIDAATENLITIAQARHEFPHEPSTATIWRWMLKGVRGTVLESIRVGGRRFTSKEACHRFIHGKSGTPKGRKIDLGSVQSAAANHAKKILDHFGV